MGEKCVYTGISVLSVGTFRTDRGGMETTGGAVGTQYFAGYDNRRSIYKLQNYRIKVMIQSIVGGGTMAKILVVDDELSIRLGIREFAEYQGYEVEEAANGKEAVERCRQKDFDVIIMDIMMPEMDGYHVLQELRKTSNIPVMILSAKDADSEKILGLNLGADDYLAKPFNPLEAVARVNSNIRRFYALGTAELSSGILTVRDLELDPEGCVLKKNGEPIELTSVEYRIMELFMKHPGKVFTKQQIYEQGWGDTYVVADNNIMVCISKLRAKLDEDPAAYIRTIRGLGYRLEK